MFSEPGLDSEGNHPFLIYVEDHSDEGGNQDPADEFWIQVKDKDGIVVLETNGPDSDPAGEDGEDGDDVSIENGNIIVPVEFGMHVYIVPHQPLFTGIYGHHVNRQIPQVTD